MFEAKLASSALLKKIVEAIKDLVTDAPFDCNENAVCLQAMDSSHVALVSLKLSSGLFESYRCDRTINLGLSLATLAKALKCANNDDTCMMKCEENDGDSITFSFTDESKDKTQDVVVKLMDIDSEHLGIPDQDYSAVVELPSDEFNKTCHDLAMFSDSVSILVTKAGIIFSGKGESGSSTVSYSPSANVDDEKNSVKLLVKDPVSMSFAIKYLNRFTKASSLAPRVKLSLSDDVPIVVEYELEENSYLRFYLAPKIDEEDNME
ncbi:hypothetical protein AB6A40_003289 [Gnathostoma spinigerum]|uniref:DNA sliding clamp PCNA n=1 Tax=Gnathostoma spinigerum TaxID=75299 RepID=A0ABD6E942_9BILA